MCPKAVKTAYGHTESTCYQSFPGFQCTNFEALITLHCKVLLGVLAFQRPVRAVPNMDDDTVFIRLGEVDPAVSPLRIRRDRPKR